MKKENMIKAIEIDSKRDEFKHYLHCMKNCKEDKRLKILIPDGGRTILIPEALRVYILNMITEHYKEEIILLDNEFDSL